MKAIICLLAVVGACFAAQQGQEPGWDIGKTYTYQVQGHALSGLRVDHDGGLQLKYKVKLTRQGQNQYYLQPKDFQVMNNCLQECQQVPNRPIPQSLLQYLEAPIQFSMTPQGKVNSIRFDHTIPHWAMNFKKAQMAPFITNIQYPQQLTRQQQQQQSQSKVQQNEKTVYGECKVQYLYEQYGQQQQHEEQNQYSPQNQQQKQQQQQQSWYQRIAGYYNDDNDSDDSSSSSQQQQDDDDNQQRGNNRNQQQYYNQNSNRNNQYNSNQYNSNQYNRNQYNDDDSSGDNSAQGFFAKLGRKIGMGSGSDEQESQEQNQIHRSRNGQESSEEQGQAERKNCDSSDQKFQFLKMYRVNDCSHTPNFSNSSSSSTQRSINKRQVFTRYYACGQNKNNYNIYHIERREATKEAQQAVQQLTLVDISSSSSARSQQIQQPSVYSNLAYNFEAQQLKQKPIVEMDREEYQKQLKSRAGVGQVDIFHDQDYQGQHTTLDVPVGKCLGLPSGWNDAISSIDPQMSCVILWEHRGCSGEAVRLERYSWGTSQLSRVNMDNRATAIQLC